MKINILILTLFLPIVFFGADISEINNKFNEADLLFNAGKYQEAILIYEKIKSNYPDSIYSLKSDVEIMKNSYYYWDLKKVIKIGINIINNEQGTEQEFYVIKFYAYWWLINSYQSLKDDNNQIQMQNELLEFYNLNKSIIKDDDCVKIYTKIKKRMEK